MKISRLEMRMPSSLVYHEKVTSNRTTALFVVLTCLFLWCLLISGMDWAAVLTLVLACMFLFYTLNYRSLGI